jgi:GNAT superfamily N-acetyltransferase
VTTAGDEEDWLDPGPVAGGEGILVGAVRALPEARLEELRALYALLDPALPPLTRHGVDAALGGGAVTLLAAVDDASARLAGVVTVVAARTPARVRAWAEDLVVDPDFRGRGIGEALMAAAATAAAAAGAQTVDGTVHPRRTAAAALYRRLGWEASASLPIRLRLSPGDATSSAAGSQR